MITEDYVSLETAKLLKEKGFDEPCNQSYAKHPGHDEPIVMFNDAGTNSKGVFGAVFPFVASAPTIQMATKWLRIVKKLDITIHYDSWACGGHSGYYIVIQRTDNDFSEVSPCVDEEDTVFFDTPESAFEAAIKYCLSALIK